MKALQIGSLSAALLWTTACGPALHPFYTSSDLYEEPLIEGFWTNGEETWEIHHVGDSRYTIASCDPECKDRAPATLFRLGGSLFLDYQESGAGSKIGSTLFPHGVLRIRLHGAGEAEIAALDDDALAEMLDQKRVQGLGYTRLGDNGGSGGRLILTASSARLQQFLARHSADPQLWTGVQRYRRSPDAAGAAPSMTGF